MEEESGEVRDVFGRRRRGGGEGNGKKEFSGNTITIASAVIAIIIFSAVVSAYPHGMHISEQHNVSYTGNDNVFLSGALTVSGNIKGLIISENISEGKFYGVEQVIITDGVEEKRFSNADITITGEDWKMNTNATINEKFGYAIAAFNSSNETAMGILTEDVIHFTCNGDTALHLNNGFISIENESWEERGNFYIVLKGNFNASVDAEVTGLQTAGGLNVSFEKSNNFDSSLLNSLDMEIPPLPFDIDGACMILGGVISIDGSPERIDNFSFFRGEGNAFISENMHLNMKAVVSIVDGSFYTCEKATKVWFIPDRIILLLPIAIAVWIISAIIRKKYSAKIEDYDKGMSGFAFVIHILALAISFYLWDQEIKYEFGESMISLAISFARDGSMGFLQLMIVPLEIIPWFAAFTFIALPVRVILSSLFSLIGLERVGKGVGKATGILMLFFAGVVYIPFFLNVTVVPLIKEILFGILGG